MCASFFRNLLTVKIVTRRGFADVYLPSLFPQIYIGVTDHLWGRHCQREFKDSKLQEYESWKEMYIRLSEEREMKLQRLTKSIISAHSNKPKGVC